jgi:hypothetical protein
LRIPLELDDDGLNFLKLKHLSWSCLLARAWWRHLQILPHTPLWESLALLCLHESIASFNHKISSEMDHIELALWNFLKVLINLDFILCTLTWSTLHFIFFLHNDDVLKMHMRAHSILFFKTHCI